MFDPLPTLDLSNDETTLDLSLEMNKDAPNDNLWKLPIDNDTLHRLQWKMHSVKIY